MTENSLTHPYPVQPADRLAEALRNELLEYGHLLDLLRTQQRLVLEENLMELPENIGAVTSRCEISFYSENKESIGARKHFAGWGQMQIYPGV